MRKRYAQVALFLFLLFVTVCSSVAQAQTADISYARYDVEIILHPDGDFTVREIQQLRFNGEFHTAFAEIPRDYLNNIENIIVYGGPDLASVVAYSQGGSGPNSYQVAQEAGNVVVDWQYPDTQPGDELTFVLEYEVVGGLWVYPEFDRLEWRAIPAERGLSVPAGRVTVNLPFAVTAESLDYTAFGPAFTTRVEALETGQRVIFEATEPIPDTTAFQVLVAFPHGLVTADPQPWQIASDEAQLVYNLDRIEVEMALAADGRLAVSEHHRLTVADGIMYSGYRNIDLLYVDRISDIGVAEGDQVFTPLSEDPASCAYCFQVTTTPRHFSSWIYYSQYRDEVIIDEGSTPEVAIEWFFPPLVKGESTTFTLQYTAAGVVRTNEDSQQLNWTVIPNYEVPVEEAIVYLRLPSGLGLEDVQIEGGQVSRGDNGDIVIASQGAIDPDSPWQIALTLPPDGTTAAKPEWQQHLEETVVAAEEARVRLARQQLVLRSLGILAGVLVILGLLVAWYLWGSRKAREIMGNYRTTPPSDLAPGIVAYLMDREPTPKGVLSSLLYLANLGLVRVNLGETLTLQGLRQEKVMAEAAIKTPTGETVKIKTHVATLFNALLPALLPDKSVSLKALIPTLGEVLPQVYAGMGQEMVQFFYGNGRTINWRSVIIRFPPLVVFFLTLLFIAPSFFRYGGISSQTIAPAFIVSVVLYIVLRIVVGWKGRDELTALGNKELKRWLGFRAYLRDIQKYGNLEEAQEILERYFAYAVALEVDETLLAQVEALGAYMPFWVGEGEREDGTMWHNRPFTSRDVPFLRTRRWLQRGSWRPAAPRKTAPARAQAASERLSLEGLSAQLTGALSNASDNIVGVLNTAVGDPAVSKPVDIVIRAAGQSRKVSWQPGTPLDKVVGEIMSKAESFKPPRPAAGSGRGGYRGSSGRSTSSSRSSFGSSRSSSRSSSSRRSGGGGRRGFG